MQKERYFTPGTLDSKSQELLAFVASSRRRHTDVRFQPAKAALLVLDMQAYFLGEDSHAFVPSAPAILPGIARLAATFSRAGRPVVFTRHLNTPEDAGMMSVWWRDLINLRSAYSHIITTLEPSKATIINKSQYDAFLYTSLEELLRERGVGQVVICGLMTHLCCETTARSAFMRGFGVFFTVDGTATYTEALHRAALLNLSHGFAVPVTVGEVLGRMQ